VLSRPFNERIIGLRVSAEERSLSFSGNISWHLFNAMVLVLVLVLLLLTARRL
jgi:hypothetical protein